MGKNNTTDTVNLGDLGSIDRNDVFGEVERFAQTYGKTSDGLLDNTVAVVAAKNTLEQLTYNLDLQIRKTAEISGEKVTEKKVEAAIKTTTQWQAAANALHAAEARVEVYKAALKTLDKKDRMLELLARVQIRELGTIQRTS